MDPAQLEQVEALFGEALEHPADERESFLERATDDDTLREQVRELLAGEDAARSYFDGVHDRVAATADDALDGSHIAQRFGPYRTTRLLGRGGMGSVYEAERVDGQFEQRVALKLIRRGMETEGAVSRFIAERQILAKLAHPSIARLLDGGVTDDGRPYFVMELVDGLPLNYYCTEQRLTLEQRLEVFVALADAVDYAHRNLVVHRDLKPGNVLVTKGGDAKLVDFGIAKPLQDDDGALTHTGARAMTPDYAAPEQITGDPITTATDVYGLGLILYELLTARRPYEGRTRTSAELEQAILRDDPVRPSTAVLQALRKRGQTEEEARPPESIADELRTTPARLSRRLAGDLDVICATALRKEPERRYASARALAEDVRRHVAGEPVSAQPDTLPYRMGKFVRRHRIGVAVAGLVAALTVGFGVSLAREYEHTARERDKAERVSQLLIELLVEADPTRHRGNELTAREVLDRGAARIESLEDQPEVQAELAGVMGMAYRNLGAFDSAETLLRRQVELLASLHGEGDSATANATRELAEALRLQGKLDAAQAEARRALDLHRAANLDADAAEDLAVLARTLHGLGRFDDAETHVREALTLLRAAHGERHQRVAEALNDLGATLGSLGRTDDAKLAYQEALEIQRERLGEDHPAIPGTLNNLAGVLQASGDLPGAEQAQREALAAYRRIHGEDGKHPALATTLSNLGISRFTQGDPAGAEPLLKQALEMRRELLAPTHPEIAQTASTLGLVVQQRGRLDEAEALMREALEIRETLGPQHPSVAHSLINLGLVLQERGELEQAEAAMRRAAPILRNAHGDDHPLVAQCLNNLAGVLLDGGRVDDAEATYADALERRRRVLPEGHPHLAYTLLGLGRTRCKQADPGDAVALLEEALEIRKKVRPADHWEVAEVEAALGACLVERDQAQATALLSGAVAVLEKQRGAEDRRTVAARAALESLGAVE